MKRKEKALRLLVGFLGLCVLATVPGRGEARPQPPKTASASVAQEGLGYVEEDLPLYPTPKRSWEDETGPVELPIVRRVRHVRGKFKDVIREEDVGFLTGKSVYLSPGHGWTWSGSSWTTQRGNSYGIVEDLSNAEAVTQFLVEYLVRAGAHVVPVREIDPTDAMVICDNEHGSGSPDICLYEEVGDGALFSDSTLLGFHPDSLPLYGEANPFEAGGNRLLDTDSSETARFVWSLNVPRSDWYNVYVSYTSYPMRAPDAHYVVTHALGEAHFRVNQRHKGGTWVFLGRFYFLEGMDESLGSVALLNDSAYAGPDIQVSADAVRLGGGMGVVDRGQGFSGHPRYEENCRSHAQFSGAPSSVYNSSSSGDHSDDVSCRSRFAAWLHEDGEDALYFSWHSNAGGGTGTSIYIYWPNSHGYCDGTQATAGSRELADSVLGEVVGDIRAVWDNDWTDRGRRCAWFGELNPSYNNEMPAALIELAFHDLPEDVEDLKEPQFRRLAARAVYQGMVKYYAARDNVAPALLPEPPTGVVARNTEACAVEVSWSPPAADLAGGDPPESYLVYVGRNGLPPGEPMDSGGATSIVLHDLEPGHVYTLQVTAVNAGGESLPSRMVAVGVSGWASPPQVLLVQGFGRFDSSQLLLRYESAALGDVDRMIVSRMNDGSYVLRHAPELGAFGVPFDSCEDSALAQGVVDPAQYEVVDLLAGQGADSTVPILPEVRQALRGFVEGGGHLLISGSGLIDELSQAGGQDEAFLGEILGAQVGAGSASYEVDVSGVAGSPLALEDGYSAVPFYDTAPEGTMTPGASATVVAEFSPGATGVAGIEHSPTGLGKVITLNFPFEGIISRVGREAVMAAFMESLGVEPSNSESCEEPVSPDAGVNDGGEGDPDTGVEADAGIMECRRCRCDDNSCSCRAVGGAASEALGPAKGWVLSLLLLLMGLWGARGGRRKPGTRAR